MAERRKQTKQTKTPRLDLVLGARRLPSSHPFGEQTRTQALDEEAQRELAKDVEHAKSEDPIFVTIRGNAQGKKHSIRDGKTLLGRGRDVQIRILDPSVSSVHAAIVRDGDRVEIEDLNSNNGTFVNDVKIKGRHRLHKEDMITVGTTVLKFVPAGELEILYHGNLIRAAYVDQLTGVYNQNYVTEALAAEFKRAKALTAKFSIILFDLDYFKKINDSWGHSAGDFALKEVCALVTENILRPSETMGRYGGDEFLLLLWNTAADEALLIAERINRLIAGTRFEYEGNVLDVTITAGVAQVSAKHRTVQDFFNAADSALYAAKARGRNCVSLAND